MKIEFESSFHPTVCTVRLKHGDRPLSDRQVERVNRLLCGVMGCQCGGIATARAYERFKHSNGQESKVLVHYDHMDKLITG